MNFIGKALLLIDQDTLDTAASLGCEPAVIKAVAEVDTVEDEIVTRYRKATRDLQTFLRDKGLYRGRIDGDFSGASRLALSLYLGSK